MADVGPRAGLAVLAALTLAVAACPAATAEGPSERIVFDLQRDEASDLDLVSLGVNDGDLRQLTTTPDYDERGPQASPDGSKVVFSRTRFECRRWRYSLRCPADLWIMGADGTGLTRVTDTPAFTELDSSLSPDGTRVAFGGNAGGQDHAGIYVADARGGGVRRLTSRQDWAYAPAWSPDGTQIAFQRWPEGSDTGAIWVIDADGTGARQVTHPLPWDTEADDHPAWSPDGRTIAFMRLGGDGRYDVYVVDADGTDERLIAMSPQYNSLSPAWSPDGSRLAISRYPAAWNYYSDGLPEQRTLYPSLFPEAGIHVLDAAGSGDSLLHRNWSPWEWSGPTWTVVSATSPLPPIAPSAPPRAAQTGPGPGRVGILPGALRLSRSGIAHVGVRCLEGPCSGRLEVWAGSRRVGSRPYLLRAESAGRVAIRISARGRRLARRRSAVRVRVIAVGPRGREAVRLTLLRPETGAVRHAARGGRRR